jgi:hypothetical protein
MQRNLLCLRFGTLVNIAGSILNPLRAWQNILVAVSQFHKSERGATKIELDLRYISGSGINYDSINDGCCKSMPNKFSEGQPDKK